ncbi:hypothetical protein SRHO_G00317620 [Serrasalmus rhombeus]
MAPSAVGVTETEKALIPSKQASLARGSPVFGGMVVSKPEVSMGQKRVSAVVNHLAGRKRVGCTFKLGFLDQSALCIRIAE